MSTTPAPLQRSTIPEFKVDGRVQPDLARDLVTVHVDDDIDGMSRLQATFVAVGPRQGERNEQLNWMDGRLLDFGKSLRVGMGATGASQEVFDGKISALELTMAQGRAPELTCFAEDALMDLRMTRRFKTYESSTDADLVQAIAAEHGLSAQADLDGPSWPVVQQWNQSDLAFLRQRAIRLAAEVWVEGGKLHVATRDKRNAPRLTLVQGASLQQVRLRVDLAQQRSEVVVGGFDDARQEGIDEKAGASDIAGDAQGHSHGAQVLERAFGARSSYRVRDVPLQGSHAVAMARAALLARARRFVTASGVADGNPQLRVGSVLRLERVGPLFEGDGFHVVRVRHQFDVEHGYRTRFEAERPWVGGAP